MPLVHDILAYKGSNVLSIGPDATVLEAADLMNQHKVGSLVVMDDGGVVGMFTERDILTRVVVPRRDPGTTRVHEVMTTEVACCRLHTSLAEARAAMKNRRIRHLPVVDESNRLLGLISIGDLNAFDAHSQEVTIHFMEEYIHGRV
jgi:CBS domain-containing protein